MTELFTLVGGLALYFGAMALLFSPALLAWGEKALPYSRFAEVDQLERDLEELTEIYLEAEIKRQRALDKHTALISGYSEPL